MTRIAMRQLERQAEFLGITIHSYRPGRTRLYRAELKDGHFSCSMPIREFSAYLDGFERGCRQERTNSQTQGG